MYAIFKTQPVVSHIVFMFAVPDAASDVKFVNCFYVVSKLYLLCCWTYIVDYRRCTGHSKHENHQKAEQITTTILLRCKCLLGNFGTSVLVGVTLTCKTQLDIIADQVCPLKGSWQRDFMSLAPWIIWIPRALWCAIQLFFIFHCLFHSTPRTCAIFLSCSCVLYFWVHKPYLASKISRSQSNSAFRQKNGQQQNLSRPKGSSQGWVEDTLWGPLSPSWHSSSVTR